MTRVLEIKVKIIFWKYSFHPKYSIFVLSAGRNVNNHISGSCFNNWPFPVDREQRVRPFLRKSYSSDFDWSTMQSYIFIILQRHLKLNIHRSTVSFICPQGNFIFALFYLREHQWNLSIGDSCIGRYNCLLFCVYVFKYNCESLWCKITS